MSTRHIFRHSITLIVLFAFLYLVFPREACAYLDPGTGSYIFQLAIAVLVGGFFVIKLYWRKVRTFFGNLFSRRQRDDD